jgi:hypothetical protein
MRWRLPLLIWSISFSIGTGWSSLVHAARDPGCPQLFELSNTDLRQSLGAAIAERVRLGNPELAVKSTDIEISGWPEGEFSKALESKRHQLDFYIHLPPTREAGRTKWSVGTVWLYRKDDVLAFDIVVETIEREFRKLGLYQELMRFFVNALPEVRYVPSSMGVKTSVNAAELIRHVFGAEENYARFGDFENSLVRMSEKERADLHAKVLESFRLIPSTKARARAGFSRPLQVVFEPNSNTIHFIVERGAELPEAPSVQFISGATPERASEIIELDAKGAVRRMASGTPELRPIWAKYRSLRPGSLPKPPEVL